MDAMPTKGLTVCGRYALQEKLGVGGQGEVWRARDLSRAEDVALKILPAGSGAWALLERESAVARRLSHPHILRVHAPVQDGVHAVLPMELATGGDLTRLRGLTYLQVVPVLLEVAGALQHAHERNVIHRDLKPANVLFDARGHVRVADFGAAADTEADPAKSVAAERALSPFSASPEQLRGAAPAVTDDIYGLGALAYELLSGHPPYHPRFELRRVLEDPVPVLEPAHEAPPRLVTLIAAMLAKDPRRRPQSMREVMEALEASLNDTLRLDIEEHEPHYTVPVDPDPAPAGIPPAVASAVPRRPATAPPAPAAPWAHPERTPARTSVTPLPGRIERTAAVAEHVVSSEPRSWPGANEERFAPAAHAFAAEPAQQAVHLGHAEVQRAEAPAAQVATARARVERSMHASGAAEALDLREHPMTARRERPEPARRERPEPARRERLEPALAFPHADNDEAAARRARELWSEIKLENVPSLMRLERERHRRWPKVLLFLVALGAGAYFALSRNASEWLPLRVSPQLQQLQQPLQQKLQQLLPDTFRSRASTAPTAPSGRANEAAPGAAPPTTPASPVASTAPAVPPLAAARGSTPAAAGNAAVTHPAPPAGTTVAPPLATAAAPRPGTVHKAATPARTARNRNIQHPVPVVQHPVPVPAAPVLDDAARAALDSDLRLGERALAAGNAKGARRAFDAAGRIAPGDPRVSDGLRRAGLVGGVRPLLADALSAEEGHDYARAAQDYSQALSLDPHSARARAGLDRVTAAFGADGYARDLAGGFAALGAGRLDEAQYDFEHARTLRPAGEEARIGLERVRAALGVRRYSEMRTHAAELEGQERWGEALQEYQSLLRLNPSLEFARQGADRVAARAQLANRLQAFLDDPQLLASAASRTEAQGLVEQAHSQASGPVLRSLADRLAILLPSYDKPVHLALLSDNLTQVAIPQIGSFGTFSRRDVELKPGKYTVIGTRAGFRDVRRYVTIAPGPQMRTITVRCLEPI